MHKNKNMMSIRKGCMCDVCIFLFFLFLFLFLCGLSGVELVSIFEYVQRIFVGMDAERHASPDCKKKGWL
jgi:hypothetical protein